MDDQQQPVVPASDNPVPTPPNPNPIPSPTPTDPAPVAPAADTPATATDVSDIKLPGEAEKKEETQEAAMPDMGTMPTSAPAATVKTPASDTPIPTPPPAEETPTV